jgi:hypothetical protein
MHLVTTLRHAFVNPNAMSPLADAPLQIVHDRLLSGVLLWTALPRTQSLGRKGGSRRRRRWEELSVTPSETHGGSFSLLDFPRKKMS